MPELPEDLASSVRASWTKTLLIVIPALILPLLVLFQGNLNPAQRDFAVLYVAGQTVAETPETLFNLQAHTEKTKALAAQYGVNLEGSTTPWLYPAVTAWLYAPFTLVSFTTAFWMITALNILALIASFHLIARDLSIRDCRVLGLLALATPAITGTIIHGQAAIFGLLLLTLAMSDKAPLRQGVWVGLLALKPLFVLQMMGWLVLKRNWRGLALAAGISILLLIASIATTGVPGFVDHLSVLRAVGTHSLKDAAEIVSQPTVNGVRMVLDFSWLVWMAIAILIVIAIVATRNAPGSEATTLLGAILIAPYMHNTEAGMAVLLIVARMLALGSSWVACLALVLAAGWITGFSLPLSVAVLCCGLFYLVHLSLRTSRPL